MAVHAPSIRRWLAIGSTLIATGALAACGGGGDNETATTSGAAATTPGTTTPRTTGTGAVAGATATKLSITAEEPSADRLAWSRRVLTARAGDVTISLDNPSSNQLPHGVEVEGQGVEKASAVIEPGADTSVSTRLQPGRYTFYCPVGNHRQLGMEGTLTVR